MIQVLSYLQILIFANVCNGTFQCLGWHQSSLSALYFCRIVSIRLESKHPYNDSKQYLIWTQFQNSTELVLL